MIEIRRMNREAVAVLEVAGRLDVNTSSQLDDAINGVFDTNLPFSGHRLFRAQIRQQFRS